MNTSPSIANSATPSPIRAARVATLASATLLLTCAATGCANMNDYSLHSAERSWSKSMEPRLKGLTISDAEAKIRARRVPEGEQLVIYELEKRFEQSTRATNETISVSNAARKIAANEAHQRFMYDTSIANAARRLNEAQGR